MLDIIDRKYIDKLLMGLNSSEIQYVLIKNIANELPLNLKNGKDVDICVREEDARKLEQCLLDMGFIQIIHPLGPSVGWSFYYGLPVHQMWKLENCPYDFRIDISFKISCVSFSQCAWVPLDLYFQEYMWNNKVWDENNKWWIMDVNSRFVYYFVRCVFDKKNFSDAYIKEIEISKPLIDMNIVTLLFEKVFFKFTKRLFKLIEERRYEIIIEEYIRFKDY